MAKKFIFISAFSAALIGFIFVAYATFKDDIVFPVTELGNCASEQECGVYCDQPPNAEPCLDFAEEHNLLSPDEIDKARDFLAIGEGPGGCTNPIECENYCNDAANIDECISFAEQHGLIPPDELAEAKKVQAAIRRGAKLPGGCTKKSECEVYCSEPSHMEECITFAEAAGFIPPDELAEARKILTAIKQGVKPPPCAGKEACDAYCSEPEHFEECLVFAEAAGLIPPEELEGARMALTAIKKGVKPPSCRGEEECDVYCSEHMEECITFAEAAGMMTPEDAAMARKTGGKGPGGCRGEEECKAFCDDPTNQEECFNFAMEYGLMSEEDLSRMQEDMARMQEALAQAPSEVRECLVQKLGLDTVQGIESGTGFIAPQIGNVVRECFEMMGSPEGMPGGTPPGGMPDGMMQGGGFQGPGGCSNEQECMQYCSDPSHQQECTQAFGGGQPPGGGFQQPPEGGPGPAICPAMPTVTDCPTGQRKELVFSSPECGDYYTCVPEGGEFYPPAEGEDYYSPPEEYEQQFKEQYEQQYEEEFQPPPDEFYEKGAQGFLQKAVATVLSAIQSLLGQTR